jgi:undecaprenyl-diphosphatase
MIPAKYAGMVQKQAAQNAGWAIFLAALSPLPYKIVCITAGALKVRFDVFILATVIGRSKRFMVEGVLIYYLGDDALSLMNTYSDNVMIGFLVLTVLIIAAIFLYRKYKKNRNTALD